MLFKKIKMLSNFYKNVIYIVININKIEKINWETHYSTQPNPKN